MRVQRRYQCLRPSGWYRPGTDSECMPPAFTQRVFVIILNYKRRVDPAAQAMSGSGQQAIPVSLKLTRPPLRCDACR